MRHTRCKDAKGFTLIEMLMVIVILGILVSIAIPNMINARVRAREASVKANMHAFQTIVEMYGLAWGSRYPLDIDIFEAEESIQNEMASIKDMENPFNQKSGRGQAYEDENGSPIPGIVSYSGYDTVYYLYGYGNNANRIQANGSNFILSNS